MSCNISFLPNHFLQAIFLQLPTGTLVGNLVYSHCRRILEYCKFKIYSGVDDDGVWCCVVATKTVWKVVLGWKGGVAIGKS
ncbi:hypothetical protein SADUNF_Sadunf17G0014500 [Salix dunnii]|uniref:Uncharacterized protein n=1 Tax=Salix dunnii TaxID=1413687 RepID=A0A835J7J9_9ROSI|nr:hypothetical protein SADUNF_Sadunf17G0014500 [Salix dunnii]